MFDKWGKSFWMATGERVGATFLMSYFGLWLSTDVIANVYDFDWVTAFGPAAAAAILSLVKCILANNVGSAGPSLANETLTGRHRQGPGTWTPDVR